MIKSFETANLETRIEGYLAEFTTSIVAFENRGGIVRWITGKKGLFKT